MFISFSPVILCIIHYINLQYNGRFYLKVLRINFVILRVSGQMEYGMYLLNTYFYKISFYMVILWHSILIVFMLQLIYAKGLYVHYILSMPLKNDV